MKLMNSPLKVAWYDELETRAATACQLRVKAEQQGDQTPDWL